MSLKKMFEKPSMENFMKYNKTKQYVKFTDDWTYDIIDVIDYMLNKGYEIVSSYTRSHSQTYILFKKMN